MHALRRVSFVLLAALLVGLAPSVSPAPPEAPGVHRIVVDQFVAWQAGLLDRAKYEAAFNAQIDDVRVKKVSTELDALGAFERAEYIGPATIPGTPAGMDSYVYHMICANADVYMRISIASDGKIAGVLFADLASGLTGK